MFCFPRREVVLCLLLASGCGGYVSELPAWIGFGEDNEDAVVLLAVTPPTSVVLAAGRIERNGWRSKGPASRVRLPASDGFVIAKVAPTQDDQAYAIVQACLEHSARGGDERQTTYATAFWSAIAPGSRASSAADAAVQQAVGECSIYAPSGEAQLPVMTAVAGRVTYVGAIGIAATWDAESHEAPAKVGVTPAAPDDIEAAQQFMAKHYPKVTARIVVRALGMMRNAQPD